MVIAAFTEYAEMCGWHFCPRSRYLMGEHLFLKIQEGMRKQGNPTPVLSWSSANSYERRYGGGDADGRRILIYRENAFGDALIVTALTHYIKHLHPTAEIDIHSVPTMHDAWRHNTDANFIGVVPTFDAMRTADHHILLEGQMENDSEPEQNNCYDNQFAFSGFHPFTVPSEFKRPYIQWGESDDACAAKWREWKPEGKYVLWHVCPSAPPRMLPIANQERAIQLLAESGVNVVLVGRQEGAPSPLVEHERVHDWTQRTAQWRALLPMIRDAACVVAPDSSVLHATAAFPDVPLVGLWGSYAASDRAKYYANHTGLDGHFACPYSPCRPQQANYPREKCAASVGSLGAEDPWCSAMRAITPERIAETVLKLI